MLSAAAAARLPSGREPVPLLSILLLGAVVWLIYTADRLLDNRRFRHILTARHGFHRQHERLLWGLVGAVGMAVAVGVGWLPDAERLRGWWLLGGVGIYLLVVNILPEKSRFHALKELLTSLLYAAGIWVAALGDRPALGSPEILLGLGFGLIAFQNLLFFSFMENEKPAHTVNLAGLFKDAFTLRLLAFVFVLVWGVFLAVSLSGPRPFQLRWAFMELFMSGVLVLMSRYRRLFYRHENYRWLADAVFWLPGLLL